MLLSHPRSLGVWDLNEPPQPGVDALVWRNRSLTTGAADDEIRALVEFQCTHVGVTLPGWMRELEDKGGYQPPRLPSRTPLPPFPFPSLRAEFGSAPAFRHPVDRVAEGLVVDGARVPHNHSLYTDDAQLVRDTWPECFDGVKANHTTDLRAYLRTVNGVGDASELNRLALSLNFDRFPLGVHPPAGVPSIPIVVTTTDARLHDRVQMLARRLRAVIGVHDSTLFLSLEGASLDTLRLVAQHVDFARVLLYFTPVHDCKKRAPYDAPNSKSWRINLSLMYVMHAVFDLHAHEYAVVVEDDVDVGRDLYLYHLALHEHAVRTPHVLAVQSNTYHPYLHCYYLGAHLRGRFVGNLSSRADVASNETLHAVRALDPDWTPIDDQSVLETLTLADTQTLLLGRLMVPWALGYTRKAYAYMLNFYLQYAQSLDRVRYDVLLQHIMSPSTSGRTDLYALVPVVPRVRGDPAYAMPRTLEIPMVVPCQHATFHVVWPRDRRHTITVGDWIERYDYVE